MWLSPHPDPKDNVGQMSCAQIEVTGGGTAKPATVSFPGAYTCEYQDTVSEILLTNVP